MVTKPDLYYAQDMMDKGKLLRNHVNIVGLQNDIARGIKNLAEDAYCRNSGGYTQTSVAFIVVLLKLLGEDGIKGKKFHIREENNNYKCYVETFSGFRFVFRGVTCGYYGEGSRGAYDILKLCQFNKEQIDRVFKENDVKGFKRK